MDMPHIPRALALLNLTEMDLSKARPLVEGNSQDLSLNHYYAQKLSCERTSGGTHNLKWA